MIPGVRIALGRSTQAKVAARQLAASIRPTKSAC
jgi:hypothetical protein